MKNKNVVSIIGAMDCEIELLKNIIENVQNIEIEKFHLLHGYIGKHEVIVAKSGVGKVCAAACTQFIADKYSPKCIINTGIAGGIEEKLSVGDIVIATELVQHDFDASALGYSKGYMCNGINPDKPTIFHADKELINKFQKFASNKIEKSKIHTGIIASGDTFVGTADKKKEINNLFKASAVEMEGCAIAQVAEMNKIPYIIVRSISDLADGTAVESLADFEYKTAQISSSIIYEFLISN